MTFLNARLLPHSKVAINRRAPPPPSQFDPFDPFGFFSDDSGPGTKTHDRNRPHPSPPLGPSGTAVTGPPKSAAPSGPLPPVAAPSLLVPSLSVASGVSETRSNVLTSSSLDAPTFTSSHPATTSSTSSHVVSNIVTSKSASASSHAEASISANSGKTSNKAGVAVGVTFAILIVAAIGGLTWFFHKKKAQEKHKWRNTWKKGYSSALTEKPSQFGSNTRQVNQIEENAFLVPQSPLSPNIYKPLPDPLGQPLPVQIAAPPSTMNNAARSSPGSFSTASSPRPTTVEMARVRRGFLPSLPDELPVNVGEAIELVSAYDDGWCLCRNNRGESGMVPLECLSRDHHQAGTQSLQANVARLSRRASSLYGGISTEGVY